jgi:hypothetical protein
VSTGNHINPNPLPPSAVKNIPSALLPSTDTPLTLSQTKSAVPQAATQPAAQAPAAATKTLADLLMERFVRVEDLRGSGSNFPYRGVCAKCGWQTHQFAFGDAQQLVFTHAQSHWRDIPLALYAGSVTADAAKQKGAA